MQKLTSSQPIGIFDSGIGGLTIANALIEALPQENIIYFGDTIHFPYGDKSQDAIRNYSHQIAKWLIKQNCKMILIACSSASAAAYETLKSELHNQALLLNVIDPSVNFLVANYGGKSIGLIGTKLTVGSNIYHKKIKELNPTIKLVSRATPLITMAIEEGFYEHKVIEEILPIYLSDEDFSAIDALVLSCTHYPLIKNKIHNFYQQKIEVIDASKIVAEAAKELLQENNLLNTDTNAPKRAFYVSDYTTSFANSARMFFGSEINLLPINL
ncbi:MAG: glutamate racemase [Gammaproteobacteria bacterium]